jgi:hypothetical protein
VNGTQNRVLPAKRDIRYDPVSLPRKVFTSLVFSVDDNDVPEQTEEAQIEETVLEGRDPWVKYIMHEI